MTMSSNALRVVDVQWEEERARADSYGELLTRFFARLERFHTIEQSLTLQVEQQKDARMRFRKEMLSQAASLNVDDRLLRLLLPDETDPIEQLMDVATEFLQVLRKVAEARPNFSMEQDQFIELFTISPALIRAAFSGVTWPIDERLTKICNFNLTKLDEAISEDP